MNRRNILNLSAMTALALALVPNSAISQQRSLKEQLVGIWTLVSAETTLPDGKKQPLLEGPNQKGLLVITDGGRFSYQTMAEMPKLASNDRLKSTPAEDKAIAHGILSYFGTYTVDEASKTINLNIERSTFPNQNGMSQKRVITAISADQLKYTNPARLAGGQVNSEWRRAQ